jgi:hypothetical protein
MAMKNHVFPVVQQELELTTNCQDVVMLVLFVMLLALCA